MQKHPDYDIVVIGAGIQGAGVAQAAVVCGYKTLVIEKFPQAGMGTSSKSSKLIHGGLRYLESGQFKLVRECLQERKLLLRNAPGLVNIIPFHIPVYAHSKRSALLIWLGLIIYSVFSFRPFSIIKKRQWPTLDKLNLKDLKYVFKYYDAQTDDRKLTNAVIDSAIKHGADVQYNAEFRESLQDGKMHQLSFYKENQTHLVKCQCIINCSGPWVEKTQKNITPHLKTPAIERIAGTHIIINQELNCGAYYIEANDKRAIFVMPWNKTQTLIGTTERSYTDDTDKVTPTKKEKDYLLETYNDHFNKQVSIDDISSAFSGLRVLPVSNREVFNKSRDSLIICNDSAPFLVTLIGGKLTAYRASSEQVIKEIKKRIPINKQNKACNTRNIRLG